MIREPDRHRVGKARLLRRQGKTYDEIRDVVGYVGDHALTHWLKGIPRPAGTFRARRFDDLARECRRLRAQGLTYDEIGEITGASVGSMNAWLGDMPIGRGDPIALAHRHLALAETREAMRREKRATREGRIAAAAESIGTMTERDLFLVGVALYWAEGVKSKPWRIADRLTFINSDPAVIEVYLAWLCLLGIEPARLRFRLQIHESADVDKATTYWSNLVGANPDSFTKPTLKRHNPTTVRYNTGDDYRGCLTIDVLKSALEYRKVEGWWRGIVTGARSWRRAD